ncbi:hypothetical protein TIFTF001_028808 [Ficus carica]|uniref:F-box associated beta-propeller type 1 domain-containing protein n=1 Tax=Ficus carica TaxID=3494 RepID=A0AA88DQN0_FICCA|nr:hypothetical protein TIFTF001_028808 [Ficus carica]
MRSRSSTKHHYRTLLRHSLQLAITSLMHCKLVSQIWHSSSKHPLSISTHLSRAKGRNPFFFCFSDYPISKLDAVDLSISDNNTFLAKTQLSQTRNDQLTKEYKVIKIVYFTEGNNIFSGAIKEPEIYVLTLGNFEWRHKGQKAFRLSCMASDTLVNGNLHWLTTSYLIEEEKRQDIIAFDLATEEFQNEKGELKDYSSKESWTRRLVIPNYVPADFRINCAPPTRSRWNGTRKQAVRVSCTLEGGDEIFYSYRNRRLVTFNLDRGGFKDFRIEGLPIKLETIIHVGSLISVDAAFSSHPSRPSTRYSTLSP